MSYVTVSVSACKCDRCGHVWCQRNASKPIVCPNCKSPYWDTYVSRSDDKKVIKIENDVKIVLTGDIYIVYKGTEIKGSYKSLKRADYRYSRLIELCVNA
jgi:uncharacterized Zn ribbon protein